MLKTPRERYNNDPVYRRLVDILTMLIYDCQCTPSEVREAAVLACIKYEEIHIRRSPFEVDEKLSTALETIREWGNKR